MPRLPALRSKRQCSSTGYRKHSVLPGAGACCDNCRAQRATGQSRKRGRLVRVRAEVLQPLEPRRPALGGTKRQADTNVRPFCKTVRLSQKPIQQIVESDRRGRKCAREEVGDPLPCLFRKDQWLHVSAPSRARPAARTRPRRSCNRTPDRQGRRAQRTR